MLGARSPLALGMLPPVGASWPAGCAWCNAPEAGSAVPRGHCAAAIAASRAVLLRRSQPSSTGGTFSRSNSEPDARAVAEQDVDHALGLPPCIARRALAHAVEIPGRRGTLIFTVPLYS